ncbi:alpha-1,2-fucosyltransferase [Moorena producens]|nr:alpha-1,2-fucosyltransferase [Moorena producens]
MGVVIVRLSGGLGNQMFQYAIGRKIALVNNVQLKLDISSFEHDLIRMYNLYWFQIKQAFASSEELAALKSLIQTKESNPVILRLRQVMKRFASWKVFREEQLMPFNPNIMTSSDKIYLDGYWQSEKYFLDIEDVIRREYTCKYEPNAQSKKIAEMIANSHSVSIHVRRGDYVSNPGTNQLHGTCSLTYYQQCVEQIAKEVLHPHFFVFSDHPIWVKENLCLDYPMTFVTHNNHLRDYEDLWLMSHCQHHIIANSSFSWWAAWLNPNLNKKVFAPKKWFNDPRLDTRDLLPDNWIKV